MAAKAGELKNGTTRRNELTNYRSTCYFICLSVALSLCLCFYTYEWEFKGTDPYVAIF